MVWLSLPHNPGNRVRPATRGHVTSAYHFRIARSRADSLLSHHSHDPLWHWCTPRRMRRPQTHRYRLSTHGGACSGRQRRQLAPLRYGRTAVGHRHTGDSRFATALELPAMRRRDGHRREIYGGRSPIARSSRTRQTTMTRSLKSRLALANRRPYAKSVRCQPNWSAATYPRLKCRIRFAPPPACSRNANATPGIQNP